MKNLALLIMTVCAIVAVICLAVRTDFPEQFWLWVVGLAGPVIGVAQFAVQWVRKMIEDERRRENPFLQHRESDKKIRTL